jgi:catalase
LQGRLFSYTDTQLIRLGGPNFHEIPINRPIAPVHNNQRDGHMRQTINKSRAAYEPNSLGGGCPFQMTAQQGGFASFPEHLGDSKVRARGEKFFDHFSQATLFYNSQTETEKDHIVSALRFELGKVEVVDIRQRMLRILGAIDQSLAERVATGLGLPASIDPSVLLNKSIPADGNPADFQPRASGATLEPSPELSILRSTRADTIKTRRVAVLTADGFDDDELNQAMEALTSQGAQARIVAPSLGYIQSRQGKDLKVHFSLLTASSVLFDAVYLAGGEKSISTLSNEPSAIEFIREAYRHCKAIGVSQQAVELLKSANLPNTDGDEGIVIGSFPSDGKLFTNFIAAVARHRNWTRELLLRPDLRGKTPRRK